jgi:hypothetical protein
VGSDKRASPLILGGWIKGAFRGIQEIEQRLCALHLYIGVVGAFFPDMVREMLLDEMAAQGITQEDIEEAIRSVKGWHAYSKFVCPKAAAPREYRSARKRPILKKN